MMTGERIGRVKKIGIWILSLMMALIEGFKFAPNGESENEGCHLGANLNSLRETGRRSECVGER